MDQGDERRPLRPAARAQGVAQRGDGRLIGDGLDPRRTWWVPAVTAPGRDWSGAPGCRRGARFLVDGETLRPTRDHAAMFTSRGECLQWIMAHRTDLTRTLPGAEVRPVELARWMLGLD